MLEAADPPGKSWTFSGGEGERMSEEEGFRKVWEEVLSTSTFHGCKAAGYILHWKGARMDTVEARLGKESIMSPIQ